MDGREGKSNVLYYYTLVETPTHIHIHTNFTTTTTTITTKSSSIQKAPLITCRYIKRKRYFFF
jgi:hypothetical protein